MAAGDKAKAAGGGIFGTLLTLGIIARAISVFSSANSTPSPSPATTATQAPSLPAAATSVTQADFAGNWTHHTTVSAGDGQIIMDGVESYLPDGTSSSKAALTIVISASDIDVLHLNWCDTGTWHIENGRLIETQTTRVCRPVDARDVQFLKDHPTYQTMVDRGPDSNPTTCVISDWTGKSCTLTSIDERNHQTLEMKRL